MTDDRHPRGRGRFVRGFLTALVLAVSGRYVIDHRVEIREAIQPRRASQTIVAQPTVTGSSEGLELASTVFQLNQQAVSLAEIEQYRVAVEQLEEARRLAPDDPLVARNLQTVLLNWGTSELLAGHLEQATQLLERAHSLGERPEVLRALGLLLHRKRAFAQATNVLERALQPLPRDLTILLALGDSYLKLDKRPQAYDVLQRARDAGAESDGLELTLEKLGREIDAEWSFVALYSPHFQASFADSEDPESVRVVLDSLEDAYTSVGGKFGFYPEAKTPVVLYAEEDFHSATLTPDWAGGAFDGRIKVPLRGFEADNPALVRSLRHEYAHSLIATLAGPSCPVWLNEGLAVWAEEDSEGERQNWAWSKIDELGHYRFSDLDRAFMTLPARGVEAAYAQSYLAVHGLVDHYGVQGLRDFLDGIRRSRDPEQALAEIFGDSWTAYLHSLEEDMRKKAS